MLEDGVHSIRVQEREGSLGYKNRLSAVHLHDQAIIVSADSRRPSLSSKRGPGPSLFHCANIVTGSFILRCWYLMCKKIT